MRLHLKEDSYRNLPTLIDFVIRSGEKVIEIEFHRNSPDFLLVKPYLIDSLNRESEAVFQIIGLPYCFLTEAFEHIVNEPARGKKQAKPCAGCRYRPACAGTWPELFHLTNAVPDMAEELIIELTNMCNLSCSRCFNKFVYDSKKYMMDEIMVHRLIDQASALGIPHVRFTGGEPLLHPGLLQFMSYAASKGLGVRLNTNGLLLEKTINAVARLADDVLMPYNPEDNVKVQRLKGMLVGGLRKGGVRTVRLGTVAGRGAIKAFTKMADKIRGLDVQGWEFYRPLPGRKEAVSMTAEEVQRLADGIIAFRKKVRFSVQIANALPFCAYDMNKMHSACLGARFDDGHVRMVVDAVGRVRPSYAMAFSLGSPYSIRACWQSPFMQKMRGRHFVPEECTGCSHVGKCLGGSRYTAWRAAGSYSAPDPLAKQKSI